MEKPFASDRCGQKFFIINLISFLKKTNKNKLATNSILITNLFWTIPSNQAAGVEGLSPLHSRLVLVETPVVGFTPSAILQRFF